MCHQPEDIATHFLGKKGKDKDKDAAKKLPLFTFANTLNAIRDTVRRLPSPMTS